MERMPERAIRRRRLLAAGAALGLLVLVASASFLLGRLTAKQIPDAIASAVAATSLSLTVLSTPANAPVYAEAPTSPSVLTTTSVAATSTVTAQPTIVPTVLATSVPSPATATIPSPTATPTATLASSLSTGEALELEMIDEINRLRHENGCDVLLQRSVALTTAARTHSRDMAENHFFDHRGSDGSDRIARAQRAGYVGLPGTRVRENIGAGAVPEDVVRYWMKLNDVHRGQLLDCGYNDIGVGYALGDGNPYLHYWTVKFGVGPRQK
jgi:uncharacterized protein YkwD